MTMIEADMVDGAPSATAPDNTIAAPADATIIGIISEKVLHAWLRNRYQLLIPFAMDLRRLDTAQFEVFVHAMLAAARSDGTHESRDRQRIEAVLQHLGADDRAHRRISDAALASPQPLDVLLRQVSDVQTSALVYAASLLVLDVRTRVNRRYLDYLAARLKLADDLIASLEARFQSVE